MTIQAVRATAIETGPISITRPNTSAISDNPSIKDDHAIIKHLSKRRTSDRRECAIFKAVFDGIKGTSNVDAWHKSVSSMLTTKPLGTLPAQYSV